MYYIHQFKFAPGQIPPQIRDEKHPSLAAARKALAAEIRLYRRSGINIFDRRPVRNAPDAREHGITDGRWTIWYSIYKA